eukprot:1204764-Heterocapsa_arctica.AAC.1
MDVSRPIPSVAELRDDGWGVNFPEEKNEKATIERSGVVFPFREHARLFYLPMRFANCMKEISAIPAGELKLEQEEINNRP